MMTKSVIIVFISTVSTMFISTVSTMIASESASVNLPLHHKVQKFSSGTDSLGWSQKKGRRTVVVVWC